ncbi:MAG TPA: DUF86 domain-containing protein [Allocoleopsis sp.]
MLRDKASLLDLARFALTIQELIKGIDKQTFMTDIRTQSAILYQIIILGEAVKRLSPEFRQQNYHIPWSGIAGMRDKLVHDYDGVNLEKVWLTITVAIPEFILMIEPLLPTDNDE